MARRNASGEGSLYQRKSDRRWVGSIQVHTTSGRTKRVYAYGKTRAEAHEELTKLKTKVSQGILTADKNRKLGDYLDYWLEAFVRPNRRPNTYDQCETIVRLYLKPGLGDRYLDKLSVPATQVYFTNLRAAGLKVSYIGTIRKVLSAALTRAMREELIPRNVARLVELPSDPGEKKEPIPWSLEEVQRYIRVIRAERLYAAYLILPTLGPRKGELLGLRWQDVDASRKLIHLQQQLTGSGKKMHIGPLKTKKSRRDLPLIAPVLDALREHYEEQKVRGITSELVFTTTSGEPIDPKNFLKMFQRFCKRNDLRVITVHDMRRTQATLLRYLGVPMRTIQHILGHSRMSTTEIYVLGDEDEGQQEAIQLVEKRLLSEPAPAQIERQRSLAEFIDSNGSCQDSCQQRENPTWWSGSTSGASTGTLTRDLFLGKKKQITLAERVTEVDESLKVRRQLLLLGGVAVSAAVKIPNVVNVDLAA
ncbi:tyrosine-type recombinase/integrase [Streptomyces sp. NPDC001002]